MIHFVPECPGTKKFVPGFLPLSLSQDKGHRDKNFFLSRDKGTTGIPVPSKRYVELLKFSGWKSLSLCKICHSLRSLKDSKPIHFCFSKVFLNIIQYLGLFIIRNAVLGGKKPNGIFTLQCLWHWADASRPKKNLVPLQQGHCSHPKKLKTILIRTWWHLRWIRIFRENETTSISHSDSIQSGRKTTKDF